MAATDNPVAAARTCQRVDHYRGTSVYLGRYPSARHTTTARRFVCVFLGIHRKPRALMS